MAKRYQDPKTGKFISKKEAEKLGILEPVLTFNESLEKYVKQQAKDLGISDTEVLDNMFSQEMLIVEFDEATGKASMQLYSGKPDTPIKDMKPEKLYAEYKDLRENFAPVSAGIEYHKTFLCGSGFVVITDDPRDKHKIEMRDECRKMCKNVYMDYYRKGLDKLLFILADDLLTYGVAGAEIVYGREIEFSEFAERQVVSQVVQGKTTQVITWDTRMPTVREWKSFKGISRLKILDKAISRLTPYVDPKSGEMKYWTLDENMPKTETQKIQEKVGTATPIEPVKFHPFEILWLSWNTRGTSLKGESIIRPALEIARLVRKIQRAIGKGFERWSNKKYFFICGTERKGWNKNAQRKFIKYLELMIKNNWTGVPVPAGFDVKDIGGEVFEGTNILNHLINMICAAMNYPRDFLEQGRTRAGDKAWLAWQVKYGSNQRMLRRDIEHQLFQTHLWCNFGKTYRVPKQNVQPKDREKRDIYVPKIIWKAEGRWQRAEELKSLYNALNVANPIGPELKLAIERRIAELLGFGEIEFPSFAELRKEMKRMAKMEELELQRKMQLAARGEKKPKEKKDESPTQEAQLEERQKGGVHKALAPTGKKKRKPPKTGGTRVPKTKKQGMPSKSK